MRRFWEASSPCSMYRGISGQCWVGGAGLACPPYLDLPPPPPPPPPPHHFEIVLHSQHHPAENKITFTMYAITCKLDRMLKDYHKATCIALLLCYLCQDLYALPFYTARIHTFTPPYTYTQSHTHTHTHLPIFSLLLLHQSGHVNGALFPRLLDG